MYVEKFTGETLEETLNLVKKKLGPEAIILKTVTNNGLKGAFKKNKVEVTAAINERDYVKKAQVDRVFSPDQREQFYQSSSADIAKSINQYNRAPTDEGQSGGYGKLGLNKIVTKVSHIAQETSKKIQSGLDDFLSGDMEINQNDAKKISDDFDAFLQGQGTAPSPELAPAAEAVMKPRVQAPVAAMPEVQVASEELKEMGMRFDEQKNRISHLEDKIGALLDKITELEESGANKYELKTIRNLRNMLLGIELSESVVNSIIKKANFELSTEKLKDEDALFEFALKEIAHGVETAKVEWIEDSAPQIVLLLSECSSGQTTAAMKIALMKDNAEVVSYGNRGASIGNQFHLTSSLFGVKVSQANSVGELYNVCRNGLKAGKTVIIDYRQLGAADEAKMLLEGLQRSFEDIKVLLCLSAIHAENVNRKIISRYQGMAEGAIMNHMDLCMSYGSIFNLQASSENMPWLFFGTGAMIPDDLELASAERILAGMFNF